MAQPERRYSMDRMQLGVDHHIPPALGPRASSHNPSPSVSPRPSMTRSWTMNTTPIMPPGDNPYHSRPLTLSPFNPETNMSIQHRSLSPSQSILPDSSWPAQVDGVPRSGSRNTSRRGPRQGKTSKERKGGPPKAKLGGPGGRTFDEMIAAGEVTPKATIPSSVQSSLVIAGLEVNQQKEAESPRRHSVTGLSYHNDPVTTEPSRIDDNLGYASSEDTLARSRELDSYIGQSEKSQMDLAPLATAHEAKDDAKPLPTKRKQKSSGNGISETKRDTTSASRLTVSNTTSPTQSVSLPSKPVFDATQRAAEGNHSKNKKSRDQDPIRPSTEHYGSTTVSKHTPSDKGAGRRTISAAGLGNANFLRKSLGGLLGNVAKPPRRVSVSRRSVNSVASIFDNVPSDPTEPEDASQLSAESKKPRLPGEPITSTEGDDDHQKGAEGPSVDTEQTITPSSSRRMGSRLQQQLQDVHIDGEAGPSNKEGVNQFQPESKTPEILTAELSAVETTESGVLASSTSKSDKPAQTNAVTHENLGKGIKVDGRRPEPYSSGDSPTEKHEKSLAWNSIEQPGELGFVAQNGSASGPVPGLWAGDRVVSAPQAKTSSQFDLSSDTRRASVGDHEQTKKRAKLRPSAAAFIPRPSWLKRPDVPPPRHEKGSDGLVPASFTFAPVLPAMRPDVQPFIPRQSPFVLGSPARPEELNLQAVAQTLPLPQTHTHSSAGRRLPSQILLGQARPTPLVSARIIHAPDFVPGRVVPDPSTVGRQGPADDPHFIGDRRVSSRDSDHQVRCDTKRSTPKLEQGQPFFPHYPSQADDKGIVFSYSPQPPSSDGDNKSNTAPQTSASSPSHPLAISDTRMESFKVHQDHPDETTVDSVVKRHTVSIAETVESTFTTADGSPLLPRRHTPLPSPPMPSSIPISDEQVFSALSPEPSAPVHSIDETPLPSFSQPDIKIDQAVNDQRFREWVFPFEQEDTRQRPAISRRYTVPTEASDAEPLTAGVASTLASRVDVLHQRLGQGSMSEEHLVDEDTANDPIIKRRMSSRSSVEFPLRPEMKTLAVVNGPLRVLTPLPIQQIDQAGPSGLDKKIDLLVKSLANLEAKLPELSLVADGLHQPSSLLADLREVCKIMLSHSNHAPRFDRMTEMVETVRSDQLALLEKIASSPPISQDLTMLNAEMRDTTRLQTEMARALDQVLADRPAVGDLQKRLETAEQKEKLNGISVIDELAKLDSRLKELQASQEHAYTRLERKAKADTIPTSKTDALIAARIAAEQERDALSETLRAGMRDIERLNEELDQARKQLQLAREEMEATKDRFASMAAVSGANAALQETILNRMAEFNQSIIQSIGSRSREYDEVSNMNKVLQGEVEDLRKKLEETQYELSRTRDQSHEDDTRRNLTTSKLQVELQKEKSLAEAAQKRIESLEKQLEQASVDRENALLIANERATYARTADIRIQAIAQESVYWRQFALESDRRKYRAYMASNPFGNTGTSGHLQGTGWVGTKSSSEMVSSPPDAQLKTPNEVGGDERSAGQTTPTRSMYGGTLGTGRNNKDPLKEASEERQLWNQA